MSLRSILIHPDPRLKKVAEPIARITPEIETLATDMLATMYEAPGIGLAAPQIGINARIFVMDATRDPDAEAAPIVMVNPQITWISEGLNTYDEGCLSIPDQYAEVTRPAELRMEWLGLDGKTQTGEFDGLWATCAQHELDHLDGILFIDHLSAIKRQMITRKMVKYKKEQARG
ncbi:peptide deformylase [Paracoccus sp. JM45]|uniref:peptide deformylase n=1 Tax=Paracoccus sp. JM45 TaxID=2283626 RepID=UPI000E6C5252|nr:peptide deformylase [Paracoccus sp. JM45]RJE80469.1 peptide deformylase [Paracoccus sp. JM45]